MKLDKLGEEMKETGTQVVLGVDPDSGDFLAELRRGNSVELSSRSPDLTETLRQLLPEGSIDRYSCGWSIEDVRTLEPDFSLEDARGVLELISRKADANVGFAWDTLTHYIEAYRAEKVRWAA